MVPPCSDRISRVPPYSRTHEAFYPYGAVTRYGPPFQTVPVLTSAATGLVRVRSPLLTESRLMSFPPGTEMFQFPGFASATYGFSDGYSLRSGLPHSEIPGSKPARGSPRLFAACHVLHRLLAPRHPPDALAFLVPRQPPPQTHPTPICDRAGTPPTRAHLPAREEEGKGPVPQDDSSDYHKKGRSCAERPAYPCQMRVLPADGRDQKERQNARLADARHARCTRSGSLHAPCPQRAPLTTSRCPNNKACRALASRECGNAWWAWADLNGRPHAYQACALTS